MVRGRERRIGDQVLHRAVVRDRNIAIPPRSLLEAAVK